MLIAIAFAEEIQGLQRIALSFLWLWQEVWAALVWAEVNLPRLSSPHELIFSSGSGVPSMLKITRFSNLSENTTEIHPSWNQYESNFLPKSKKTQKNKSSIQFFVILGSLLQWRWQWASIGHSVYVLVLKDGIMKYSVQYTQTFTFINTWRRD